MSAILQQEESIHAQLVYHQHLEAKGMSYNLGSTCYDAASAWPRSDFRKSPETQKSE